MENQKQAENEAFLTPVQVQKILKIGRDTFYRMVKEGQIPGATKVGDQWRINSALFWNAMRRKAAN